MPSESEESIVERTKLRRQRSDEIANEEKIIVERILEFYQLNQSGQGLKILAPNQMLSEIPVFLAKLKAGNISEKLKKEVKQLLHSLYRSKKLTKQISKSLVDII